MEKIRKISGHIPPIFPGFTGVAPPIDLEFFCKHLTAETAVKEGI